MSVFDAVANTVDFGTAGALKRGRSPLRPYVPVIYLTDDNGMRHQEQLLGVAYAKRSDALGRAQRIIDRRREALAANLARPTHRALREQYGLPRHLSDVAS